MRGRDACRAANDLSELRLVAVAVRLGVCAGGTVQQVRNIVAMDLGREQFSGVPDASHSGDSVAGQRETLREPGDLTAAVAESSLSRGTPEGRST